MGWFAEIILEAQGRTIESIRFLIERARLLDRLRSKINDRQEKALIRMMAEGPDGFVGGLSAHNYRTITAAATVAPLIRGSTISGCGSAHWTVYHPLRN